MKKLINDPNDVLTETVAGFAAAHSDLVTASYDPIYLVSAAGPATGRVAVVSGGGSGHEPLHGGFVGPGMLDAAVPGAMFTSPTPDQIEAAVRAVDGGGGVLAIVKNYTGDVMNFEMALELVDGEIETSSVLVNDDVAVEDSTWTAGRRGVAGTVIVEKIAGASAARGDDLATVTALANKVIANVRSMGVALAACTVPHVGQPSFDLGEDEIEFGVGIHGEPGRERIPMAPADAITEMLLNPVLEDLGVTSGENVLLMVNGMGATPASELYIVFRHAQQVLASRGITVTRSLVGNYVTSLDMQGASITVARMDDELLELWDAPVHTAAIRW